MSRLSTRWSRCRASLLAAGLLVVSLRAQTNAGGGFSRAGVPLPPGIVPNQPVAHSPVEFFRNLLAMPSAERENYLTNKAPDVRARLQDKVHEYLALDPNERELRLQATELRWYLLPLLHAAPTNRASRLATVPDGLRILVESRLQQWDALPSSFQQEFLDSERTLRYFSRVDTTNGFNAGDAHHPPGQDEQARWNALSANERQKISDQFNQFFELTMDEKQKTLNTLSSAERRQMETTLLTFSNLPPVQRLQCLRAFTEFASMLAKDRAEFLKNAEHWSQMSPKERQAWRDLVSAVPAWPPIPTASLMPPKPPKILPHSRLVATNVD